MPRRGSPLRGGTDPSHRVRQDEERATSRSRRARQPAHGPKSGLPLERQNLSTPAPPPRCDDAPMIANGQLPGDLREGLGPAKLKQLGVRGSSNLRERREVHVVSV